GRLDRPALFLARDVDHRDQRQRVFSRHLKQHHRSCLLSLGIYACPPFLSSGVPIVSRMISQASDILSSVAIASASSSCQSRSSIFRTRISSVNTRNPPHEMHMEMSPGLGSFFSPSATLARSKP